MKHKLIEAAGLTSSAVFALALASCDVEKVEEGSMPEVEVKGEAELPEYDVDTPEVDVETKKVEVEVPTGVDVDVPEDDPAIGDVGPGADDDE